MSCDDELIVKPLLAQSGKLKRWYGSWPANCEMHELAYAQSCPLKDKKYFVDGKTVYGYWALMCPICFEKFGSGLGPGRGQKYDSKTLVKLEG